MRAWLSVFLGLASVALTILFMTSHAPAQSTTSERPCTLEARFSDISSSTQLISSPAGNIRICFYTLSLGLNATTTAQFQWGTGTTCGSNTVDASAELEIGSAVTAINPTTTAGDGSGVIDESPTRGASNFCVILTGSGPAADGFVQYGYF